MNKKNFTLLYRITTIVIVLVAVAAQLKLGLANPNFTIANFFSYFTIESNILLLASFALATASTQLKRNLKHTDFFRGAVTLYMATTGIVYFLLLRSVDVQITAPWVNNVLHYIAPCIAVFDWLYNKPAKNTALKSALVWLIFPSVYLVYSLIRGHFTDWYPYPFLNVNKNSALTITVICVVMSIGLICLTKILTFSRKRTK